MLLSEAEIKAIMREYIKASQPKALEMWQEKGGLKEGYAGLLNLMDTLGAVWADALKEAAHAIAERETAKVAELKAENERLTSWVNDLQSGMYINCVYCGHRYGPDDEVPSTMAEVLKEHVEQCPKHPMSALKAENERLRKQLAIHETPSLCIVEGWPHSEEAIALFEKAGIDVKVVDVKAAMMMDHYGELPQPPYLKHSCPGGSGIERLRELVARVSPFVYTGGDR